MCIARTRCVAAIIALMSAQAFAQGVDNVKDVYTQRCQSCHGVNSKATPQGRTAGTKDFDATAIWNQPNSQWAKAIANGLKKMPPYGRTISAQQIDDLVVYIRAIAKPRT